MYKHKNKQERAQQLTVEEIPTMLRRGGEAMWATHMEAMKHPQSLGRRQHVNILGTLDERGYQPRNH